MIEENEIPWSQEAEQAVLGNILFNNALWLNVSEQIGPEVFLLDSHRRIFSRMSAMMRAGENVDILTLGNALSASKEIQEIGGWSYIASLTEGLPRAKDIDSYVKILREKYQLRCLIKLGDQIQAQCGDNVPIEEITTWAERELYEIASSSVEEVSNAERSEEVFEGLIRRREGKETKFLPSGIDVIDKIYGGYAAGELTVLGGRPKQGKSSAVMQAIAHNCTQGNPVDLYTMEMRDDAVRLRLWAILSSVAFHKLRHPERMNEMELTYVKSAIKDVARWPLYICDKKLSADEIVTKVKIGKLRRGTKLAAIDYLQKMDFPGKLDQRFAAISQASAKLADLANATGISVLLLSSLTESKGRHRNDPPTLQDLRGSGDIQYDAHTVYLIHREINKDTEKLETRGQIILAAARSDQGGSMEVKYDENYLTFY